MSSVMIKCPNTGLTVLTAIETSLAVFQVLPEVPARMMCPACGKEHIWTTSGAWLAEETAPTPGIAPDKPAAA